MDTIRNPGDFGNSRLPNCPEYRSAIAVFYIDAIQCH
jgi:hypothetical protein